MSGQLNLWQERFVLALVFVFLVGPVSAAGAETSGEGTAPGIYLDGHTVRDVAADGDGRIWAGLSAGPLKFSYWDDGADPPGWRRVYLDFDDETFWPEKLVTCSDGSVVCLWTTHRAG